MTKPVDTSDDQPPFADDGKESARETEPIDGSGPETILPPPRTECGCAAIEGTRAGWLMILVPLWARRRRRLRWFLSG